MLGPGFWNKLDKSWRLLPVGQFALRKHLMNATSLHKILCLGAQKYSQLKKRCKIYTIRLSSPHEGKNFSLETVTYMAFYQNRCMAIFCLLVHFITFYTTPLYYTITFLSGIFCATYKSWIFLKSENTSSGRATIMLEDKSLVKKKIINKEVNQY